MSLFDDLKRETDGWRKAVVVRTYEGSKGQARYPEEATILSAQGYLPQGQMHDPGHVHVGRLVATGGWSVLAGEGGIRSQSKSTVTFIKQAHAEVAGKLSTSDVIDELRKLNAAHDSGLLGDDAYQAKKAELMALL